MFTNLGIQDKSIVVVQKPTSSGRGKFTLRIYQTDKHINSETNHLHREVMPRKTYKCTDKQIDRQTAEKREHSG